MSVQIGPAASVNGGGAVGPVNIVSGASHPARPAASRPASPLAQAPSTANRPLPARPIPVQKGAAMPRGDEPQEGEEEDVLTWQQYLKHSPPWLVSTVLHMVLLIVLALWFLAQPRKDVNLLEVHFAAELGDINAEDLMSLEDPNPVDAVLTPQNLPPVEDPFAAPPEITAKTANPFMSSTTKAPMIGLALNGRSVGSKAGLLRKYGGNAQSEAAVKMALDWLVRQQLQDGSWSLRGPYRDGGSAENHVASSAMAVLAFLGAGYVHNDAKGNPYKETVARGVKYIVKMQQEDGSFPTDSSHHRFYTQGQCTIALCELYAMTGDPEIKAAAEKAVKFCVATQSSLGGWRYHERDDDADTSVTGWILMGLQSAKMGGLEVPQNTFDKLTRFLDAATIDGGSLYGYLANTGDFRPSMTAEGLLCRQYLGWSRNHEKLQAGVKTLLDSNLPQWGNRDVYYWYYATQVMHHMEGKEWEKWNGVMRDMLVNNQVKAGNERGSWNPDGDAWGNFGGRLYVTCLSVYMLEVYYRHMPLYSDVKLR